MTDQAGPYGICRDCGSVFASRDEANAHIADTTPKGKPHLRSHLVQIVNPEPIEPAPVEVTDAMIEAGARALFTHIYPHRTWVQASREHADSCRDTARAVLTAALSEDTK